MKAIIICGDQNFALQGLDERQPAALIQIGDRPMLQHVVEYLISAGAETVHFLVSHLPEKIEEFFGDGVRWGQPFEYHLSSGTTRSFQILKAICSGFEGEILLASAESCPCKPLPAPDGQRAHHFLRSAGGQDVWTGWARFDASKAQELFQAFPNTESAARWTSGTCRGVLLSNWINVESCAEILASQRCFLEGNTSALQATGTRIEKNAWIGRNTRVHPTARLQPPFWIGAHCRIEPGAQIGPYAIVGENCVVEAKSAVRDSLVTCGTFIGPSLELADAILDRNLLVNVRLNAAYLISEAFMAGSLLDKDRSAGVGLFERILALLLFLTFSPALIGTLLVRAFGGNVRLRHKQFVFPSTVRAGDAFTVRSRSIFEPTTKHFWDEFLPGLPDVISGKLALVGLKPREADEIQRLPADWRAICLQCKPGLITEATLISENSEPDEDTLYSAEAYYFGMRSFRYEISLLSRYLARRFSFGTTKRLLEEQ